MLGKIFGGAAGAAINKEQHGNPIVGAAIGIGTMALARRFLPARIAALGATFAAGYITKKFAERAERRETAETARKTTVPAGVADSFALLEDESGEAQAVPVRKTKASDRKLTRHATRPAPAKRKRSTTRQSANSIKVPSTTR